MTYKPLTDLQIWGDEPPEEDLDQDEMLEEILAGEFDEDDHQKEKDYFDANWCPNCGEPYNMCICDLINIGEDYDVEY